MALNLALCFSDVHSQILQQPLLQAMEQRRLRCSQWQTPSYWTHHASPAGAREEAMADFIARWLDRSPDNG